MDKKINKMHKNIVKIISNPAKSILVTNKIVEIINSVKEKCAEKNNENRRLVTDIPSTALFGNHGLKVCRCSNTEIRYRLYDNHTWEEVCIKCNAKSPSNHR